MHRPPNVVLDFQPADVRRLQPRPGWHNLLTVFTWFDERLCDMKEKDTAAEHTITCTRVDMEI
jgi:hypothetical protein